MTAAGIDVGKANLDLAVDGQAGVARFANTRVGIAKLIKHLQLLGATRTVVEATGGYGRAAAGGLQRCRPVGHPGQPTPSQGLRSCHR